jgi:hypothetical protein
MEKRNFTRVTFSGGASIKYKEQIFWGNIENVSLQGFFIKTKLDLPLDNPLEVTIYQNPNSSIHLLASVVRTEQDGLGMKISGVDVNSFVRLRDVVSEQCSDHTLLMNETYKMAHCIN